MYKTILISVTASRSTIKEGDANTDVVTSDYEKKEVEDILDDDNVSCTSSTSVDSAFVNTEERWQRKPKKKPHSYFNSRFLKRMKTEKLQLTVLPEETESACLSRSLKSPSQNINSNEVILIDSDNENNDDDLNIRFLEHNGLISALEYYTPPTNYPELFVTHHSQPNSNLKHFTLRSLNDLNPAKSAALELNHISLLSLIIASKHKLHHNSVWTVERSVAAIQNRVLIGQIPLLRKLTYMPLCTMDGEKWRLLVVDVEQKTILFFNPFGSTITEGEEYLAKFLAFLHKYNVSKQLYATYKPVEESGWKANVMPHTTLDPSKITASNVAILWLLNEVLKTGKKPISVQMDLQSFCDYLRTLVLDASDDITNICLRCGKGELKESVSWTQCNACCRWIHYTCEENAMSESFSRPGIIYFCQLCSRFFKVKTFVLEKSSLLNVLPNGLVDDIKYYVPCSKMGKYYTVTKHSGVGNTLSVEDFSLLTGEQCLSNMVVDYCLQIIFIDEVAKHEDLLEYIILPSVKVELMLYTTDELTKDFYDTLPDFDNRIILIPLLRHFHFTLLVVNLKEQTYTYLDPLMGTYKKCKEPITKFFEFLQLYNIHRNHSIDQLQNFKEVPIQHCHQSDAVNCGVFIIHYVECILTGSCLQKQLDTGKYRIELQQRLLRSAEDMTNLCIECARQTEEKFLKCSVCTRGTHVYCLRRKWTKENICFLCNQYLGILH